MVARIPKRPITRRDLLKSSSWLALSGVVPARTISDQVFSAGPGSRNLDVGPNIYESIGVRPIINCKGTFTIISGSQSLPEVKKAMEEASRHYVQMDELMEAVGQRLAEITKAEWGIVTAGCSAAITNATAACIAGSNPERMQRLPNLQGLKNEIIMAKYSRNVYDHAARMLGMTIVEVNSAEGLERAFNARTAMVLIFSSPPAEKGPLSIENTCRVARSKGVPVLIDAAAEVLTIPNHHLRRGATMVAYSGGKCLRGPQCAGLLLGQKDYVRAAWSNSAPHHAFGRSLKVAKEEIMGMLAAVEVWAKRDQDAEWKTWESWLAYISDRVTKVPGVSTEYVQPIDLSNHAPQLRVMWDAALLKVTGTEIMNTLADGNPRILLAGAKGSRPDQMASSVTIMPYMMQPEDHKIVAEALYQLLSKPPKFENPVIPTGQPENVAGVWHVQIEHDLGTAGHLFFLEQIGNVLHGVHEGETIRGELNGSVHAARLQLASVHPIEGTSIEYSFAGISKDGTMSGTVSMGEYGTARWKASRASQGAPHA
jgi:D-glucosaminate-6-phosphate ammonia-lyase